MLGPLGLPELIFILVLALLIFGPKKLPEIGRTLGRGLAEFRRASDDLKRTFNTELALEEEARPPVKNPAQASPAKPVPGTAPRQPQQEVHEDDGGGDTGGPSKAAPSAEAGAEEGPAQRAAAEEEGGEAESSTESGAKKAGAAKTGAAKAGAAKTGDESKD